MVARETPEVGRVTVEITVTNDGDRALAEAGHLPADRVRHARLTGIVDTGAAMLVLPESVTRVLGLPKTGEANVRYADRRTATRDVVGRAAITVLGRTDTFTAVVEPGRADALIGAIVLEALDLLVDCRTQALTPRDPDRIIAEIE